jgi:hypothetical protein
MAVKKGSTGLRTHTPIQKKTSISGKASMVKKSTMNKHQKRSYKKYQGQGR